MAYKQRWLEYFDVLDVDGSGFIDPADLEHSKRVMCKALNKPEDSPEVQKATAAFQGIMQDFDSNKDGKVSREEMLAGVEKHFVGKTPETAPVIIFPDWWKDSARRLLEAADVNNNGEISCEELRILFQRMDPALTDDDINAAYKWVSSLSPAGKLDPVATSSYLFFWATSPESPPELYTLTPAFRKRH